jgi:hypothetical protein
VAIMGPGPFDVNSSSLGPNSQHIGAFTWGIQVSVDSLRIPQGRIVISSRTVTTAIIAISDYRNYRLVSGNSGFSETQISESKA